MSSYSCKLFSLEAQVAYESQVPNGKKIFEKRKNVDMYIKAIKAIKQAKHDEKKKNKKLSFNVFCN